VLFVIFVVGSGDQPAYTPEAGIAKGQGRALRRFRWTWFSAHGLNAALSRPTFLAKCPRNEYRSREENADSRIS
jgi:hypothetical protein